MQPSWLGSCSCAVKTEPSSISIFIIFQKQNCINRLLSEFPSQRSVWCMWPCVCRITKTFKRHFFNRWKTKDNKNSWCFPRATKFFFSFFFQPNTMSHTTNYQSSAVGNVLCRGTFWAGSRGSQEDGKKGTKCCSIFFAARIPSRVHLNSRPGLSQSLMSWPQFYGTEQVH